MAEQKKECKYYLHDRNPGHPWVKAVRIGFKPDKDEYYVHSIHNHTRGIDNPGAPIEGDRTELMTIKEAHERFTFTYGYPEEKYPDFADL